LRSVQITASACGRIRAARGSAGLSGTSAYISAPPAAASIDTESITVCHGHCAPSARRPCGAAVPSTSAPTSSPSAAPSPRVYQPAAIFMPTG
jgi:hypothetical protein